MLATTSTRALTRAATSSPLRKPLISSSIRPLTSHSSSSSRSLSSPFRPTSQVLLQHTQPRPFATPVIIGAGLVTAGLIANLLLGSKSAAGPSGKWIKGGFNAKMDKKEAAQILGLRETALTRAKVKEAHRRMMIANHPDRGGAPYLASSKYTKIKE